MSFRFGIIGAGNIARRFRKAVALVPGAEVVAVASADPARAARFAAENAVPRACANYEELLSAPDVDCAYIATTHNFHHANALLCCGHRKPFLCEKPMALTKAEAESAFAAARAAGVFAMEAMWSRFLPAAQKARELITGGVLGEPVLAESHLGWAAGYDPAGRLWSPALAGGALYDIGVYCIEMLTFLLGRKVTGVAAHCQRTPEGVDHTVCATLDCGGVPAIFQTSIAADLGAGIKVYGRKGWLSLPEVYNNQALSWAVDRGPEEHWQAPHAEGFTFEIEETIACVRAGKLESAIVPHADTIECAGVFERILAPR